MLGPFERSRLEATFTATPPIGRYRYVLVASDSRTPRLRAPTALAPAAAERASTADLMAVQLLGPTPAAAQRWRPGQAWGVGVAELVIVE